MYDSLSIWQNRENLKDSGYLQRVPTLLKNATHSVRNNGTEYMNGYIENLFISISENGIAIKGSLNKFWHEDNFCKLTRQEAQHSIEKLQDLNPGLKENGLKIGQKLVQKRSQLDFCSFVSID